MNLSSLAFDQSKRKQVYYKETKFNSKVRSPLEWVSSVSSTQPFPSNNSDIHNNFITSVNSELGSKTKKISKLAETKKQESRGNASDSNFFLNLTRRRTNFGKEKF